MNNTALRAGAQSANNTHMVFTNEILKAVRLCVLRTMCHKIIHISSGYQILRKVHIFVIYFPTLFIAACAAANLAIGTLNGEQDT